MVGSLLFLGFLGNLVNGVFLYFQSRKYKKQLHEELKSIVQQKIHSVNDKYYAVPKIENSYV